jgi:hypothetical protein
MRISSAHVLAIIAIVLALGGNALAFQLAKNSVGSKQLKKSAVNGAKVKNNSLTGSDINEATLGTVPSATQANQAKHADGAGNADALGGVPAGRYVTSPAEPVHLVGTEGNPPFESTFTNLGPAYAPAGFYKDQFGVVHLQGLVHPPGFAGTIFTLPEGYRPNRSYNFTYFGAMADDEKIVPVVVNVEGRVEAVTSNYSNTLNLDGITFRAES